jgi:hypothetical protein
MAHTLNRGQLTDLLMTKPHFKEVFAVDEDANLTFRIVRVEENEEGIWLQLEEIHE